MSEKEFPSCAYDVCAEFDCEETMALALIATRNELERTHKVLEIAVDALKSVRKCLCEMEDPSGATILRMACESATIVKNALEQITALTKGGDNE